MHREAENTVTRSISGFGMGLFTFPCITGTTKTDTLGVHRRRGCNNLRHGHKGNLVLSHLHHCTIKFRKDEIATVRIGARDHGRFEFLGRNAMTRQLGLLLSQSFNFFLSHTSRRARTKQLVETRLHLSFLSGLVLSGITDTLKFSELLRDLFITLGHRFVNLCKLFFEFSDSLTLFKLLQTFIIGLLVRFKITLLFFIQSFNFIKN